MPRRPRSYCPGIPVHVVQRGVNRQACFFADEDRALYITTLAEMCRRFAVDLHAYVLMSNHVHLRMTPSDVHGISRVMQCLGRVYVCRVNQRIGRTGTLWEGRHRDSLIESNRYLLACQRYIECNPVRAGMVQAPDDHHWSSFRENLSGDPGPPVTPHALYRALGHDASSRRQAYEHLFALREPQADAALRMGLRRCFPVGDEAFVERLRETGAPLGRPVSGRPRSEA